MTSVTSRFWGSPAVLFSSGGFHQNHQKTSGVFFLSRFWLFWWFFLLMVLKPPEFFWCKIPAEGREIFEIFHHKSIDFLKENAFPACKSWKKFASGGSFFIGCIFSPPAENLREEFDSRNCEIAGRIWLSKNCETTGRIWLPEEFCNQGRIWLRNCETTGRSAKSVIKLIISASSPLHLFCTRRLVYIPWFLETSALWVLSDRSPAPSKR